MKWWWAAGVSYDSGVKLTCHWRLERIDIIIIIFKSHTWSGSCRLTFHLLFINFFSSTHSHLFNATPSNPVLIVQFYICVTWTWKMKSLFYLYFLLFGTKLALSLSLLCIVPTRPNILLDIRKTRHSHFPSLFFFFSQKQKSNGHETPIFSTQVITTSLLFLTLIPKERKFM